MRYYPAYLDIRGRRCLVVGGGRVAERKVRTLLASDAHVTVVSPECRPQIHRWATTGRIDLRQRPYQETDLEHMFLVIGATDDSRLNRRIGEHADQRRILCNIADRPQASSFIVPSVVRRGDLIISVSTSGTSPAMAKRIRRELDTLFGNEYATLLQLLGAVRQRLLQESHHPANHRQLFQRLLEADLLIMIREGRIADIDGLLAEIVGEGYTFRQLTQGAE